MQTIVQNISNSFGYVKCGEILKSRQSDQDPYILRCIQCQEIYLLLESFLLHFEDECRIASSTKKRIRKTKTVKDDKTEDAIHEVENPAVKLESNNHMQMEDPLIVVKNEVDDDNSIFEDECKIQESGTNDLLENPETNNLFIVSEYHTPDDEEDETSFNTQDDNDSEDKESDETQKSNDVYLQQTFETSIKTKYKHKGKPKLKCSLYPHSENLQESVRTHNEQHMENDIFSTLSGSGYQRNFQSQPTYHPKQSYMETGAYFEQNSKVNNKNTLQSVGGGYYMDYYSQPTDLQGQPNKVSGQLYGKSFKGDISINKPSSSKSASSAFVSSFMKSQKNVTALIAAYKEQPQVWNKNMPFYGNKLKRREFMEQIAQQLNQEHKLNLTGSQVSAVVVHLCRKYQEDLQRVQEKDVNEDKAKKQHYITPWFIEQLEFIKPYLENYSLEILLYLDSNLAHLLPEQIVKILEIYKGFSNLWNSNLIEYHCKNKRQETLIEMVKSIEENMSLKITEKILEEYIRTIHNYFSKEKRKILNSKKDKGSAPETSTSEYYEHLIFLYDHVRPFRCSVCGGEYINPLHFKMHQSNHDGTVPFTCSQCNKTFKRVNVYISHAKRHLEDLNHVCKECGKKFITFTNLRLHMRVHTGDKPYCCEMCGESFRFLQTLSNHRRRHEKRYLHSCKICSQGFYSKLRHDDHMNSHMNIRSYICDICNKAFITKRALHQHKVVHEDVRKHACKLCGKTFKHRAGVNQHMKTHDIATSDEKSFVQL